MARTQAPDYEQRREAIVEKAAQLFASGGFTGTSVAELAEACKTSKSLIYHYYPSKEDILYAVMTSHIDELVEDVETTMAQSESAERLLDLLIHSFMRRYIGAASRQKVLLNDLDNLPKDKRGTIVAKQRRIIEAVQSLLVSLEPGLADHPAKARVKTMLLFGMINWTHTWFARSGQVSGTEVADMAVQLILSANKITAQAS